MALAADTLDELVTADLKSEWLIAKGQWFPRSDTPENAAYDKRTPGKYNADICDHFTVSISDTSYYLSLLILLLAHGLILFLNRK